MRVAARSASERALFEKAPIVSREQPKEQNNGD